MEKHVLSKSTFIRGVQCLKSLYLYKHHIQLRDPLTAEQQAIFSRGNSVGRQAQKLFPGGVDVSPSSASKYQESVEQTTKLIRKGATIIYEAAFQFNGVLVALDILVNRGGKWYAYEVKSSARITQTYVMDASIQYHVISNCGIDIEEFFLVYLNTDYIRKGAIEVERLFAFTPVKKDVLKNIPFIEENIEKQKQTILQETIPDVKVGEHCYSPYKCSFYGHCWREVPSDSVFELGGINRTEQFSLFEQGYTKIIDIPTGTPITKNVTLQVESLKTQRAVIDKEGIKKFIASINYPIYFIDFETFMPAVPLYEGTHPYQHIPFQYSLHFKEHKNDDAKHLEFLANTGNDPRREFIEQLIADTSKPGDILVFGAAFEKSVLNNLKKIFPEYTEQIDYILYRIKDLMYPFENKLYYHYKMKGSNSLKQILPALVPELTYTTLQISSGVGAMYAYEKLQSETDIMKISEIRDNLLEYCKLDTLAMVKIVEVLEKV